MENRIKAVRKHFHLTQPVFAERIGATRPMIASYEGGKVVPSEPVLRLISSTFGVDYVWLKTGAGEMFTSKENEILAAVDNMMTGDNKTAQAIVRMMAKLDEKQWAALEEIIDLFKNELDGSSHSKEA